MTTGNTAATNWTFNWSMTVQLLQYYHPEPLGRNNKNTLTQCDIWTIPTLHHLHKGPCCSSYLRHLAWCTFSTACNSADQLTKARRSSWIQTDQVTSRVKLRLQNFKEVNKCKLRGEIKSGYTLYLWESDTSLSPQPSALDSFSLRHTVTWPKTHKYNSHTTCCHFARLNLWCSLPSHQLAAVCLFSLQLEQLTEAILKRRWSDRGSNLGWTVSTSSSRDTGGQDEPPCWS